MSLYSKGDLERISPEKREPKGYRTEFRKDYGRLLHSASFRRLQGKTQLFPGDDSDFFRNRLTHSLEVAQIAHCIALRINRELKTFKKPENSIDTNLVEFAALAHDLGHPPFGHNGEQTLNDLMAQAGGFEGNAQTLRIITFLSRKLLSEDEEGRERSLGLNLTKRAIVSVLKYDEEIPLHQEPISRNDIAKCNCPRRRRGEQQYKVLKGFYGTELDIITEAKRAVLGKYDLQENEIFKTIECSIMDVADDISYSTYDLEDAFKAGFLDALSLIRVDHTLQKELLDRVNKGLRKEHVAERTFEQVQDVVIKLLGLFGDVEWSDEDDPLVNAARISQLVKTRAATNLWRTAFTSKLVARFVGAVRVVEHEECLALSQVRLDDEVRVEVEVLKNLTYLLTIRSHRLRIVEDRGKDIVSTLFQRISETPSLMPDDFWHTYESLDAEPVLQQRVICDFIAGMTDRYAVEFYARLTSEEHRTIFKPM